MYYTYVSTHVLHILTHVFLHMLCVGYTPVLHEGNMCITGILYIPVLVVNTWEKNPGDLVFLLFSISIVIHVIISKTIVLNIPLVQQTCPNIVHFVVVIHTKSV